MKNFVRNEKSTNFSNKTKNKDEKKNITYLSGLIK